MIFACPLCKNISNGTFLISIENESLNNVNSVNYIQDIDSLTCAICLDEIILNEISMLRCGHKYHTLCITTWFKHSQNNTNINNQIIFCQFFICQFIIMFPLCVIILIILYNLILIIFY